MFHITFDGDTLGKGYILDGDFIHLKTKMGHYVKKNSAGYLFADETTPSAYPNTLGFSHLTGRLVVADDSSFLKQTLDYDGSVFELVAG